MAAVLKSFHPLPKPQSSLPLVHQSLPKGEGGRAPFLDPRNLHVATGRGEELSEVSCIINEEEEEEEEEEEDREAESEGEYELIQRDEAADMPPEALLQGYGSLARRSRRRRRHRRHNSPILSPPFTSLSPRLLYGNWQPSEQNLGTQHRKYCSTTALNEEYGAEYEHLLGSKRPEMHGEESVEYPQQPHESSSSEEDPPIIELIYRRNFKDKTKLIVLPVLYLLLFFIAGVFGFYSIEALVVSYKHPVRTVKYETVDAYDPIGIAFFLQDFATYENCEFRYGDDLSPHPTNLTPLFPEEPCNTTMTIIFHSTLINQNRTALVFRGPTQVSMKQSLQLNFSLDTSKREFGAIEYLLFNNWWSLERMSVEQKSIFLGTQEAREPLYTVPAGFRSWIKMYYIIRKDSGSKKNISEFYLNTDFSTYHDSRPIVNRTTDPVVVLFEWKSNTYEFISELVSTNVWNTLGSLAGVFVTLAKAGEYFKDWIKRLRRERIKKQLSLKELEEKRQRALQEYERRREEKKLRRSQLTPEKAGLEE